MNQDYCIKYYINQRAVTGLYCRAHANIHIAVIKCVFNCCFNSFVVFIYLLWGQRTAYSYIFIQTLLGSFRIGWGFSKALCVIFSWIASRRAEPQSYVTAPHWSNRITAGSYKSHVIYELMIQWLTQDVLVSLLDESAFLNKYLVWFRWIHFNSPFSPPTGVTM